MLETYERKQTVGIDLFAVKEQHLYGSERVGMIQKNLDLLSAGAPGNAIVNVAGERVYELSNHLGNVLATMSDKRVAVDVGANGTVDYFKADILSATDYAAFGAPLAGRSFNAPSYRYGFNGKENDMENVGTGEGTQDYGMRIYNPAIGKFLSVDPISPDYPGLTPYQFASNMPIYGTDLDGLECMPATLEWLFEVEGGGVILTMPKLCPYAAPMPPIAPLGFEFSTPNIGNWSELWTPSDIRIKGGVIETPDFDITYYNPQTYDALKGYARYQIGQYDDQNYSGGYKVPKDNKQKTKNDVPDWAKGHRPRMDNGKGKPESGKEFAKRLMDKKYGEGEWNKKPSDTGPGSEFNRIKKWGDTDFKDVLYVPVQKYQEEEKKYIKYKQELQDYHEKKEQWKKDHPSNMA